MTHTAGERETGRDKDKVNIWKTDVGEVTDHKGNSRKNKEGMKVNSLQNTVKLVTVFEVDAVGEDGSFRHPNLEFDSFISNCSSCAS